MARGCKTHHPAIGLGGNGFPHHKSLIPLSSKLPGPGSITLARIWATRHTIRPPYQHCDCSIADNLLEYPKLSTIQRDSQEPLYASFINAADPHARDSHLPAHPHWAGHRPPDLVCPGGHPGRQSLSGRGDRQRRHHDRRRRAAIRHSQRQRLHQRPRRRHRRHGRRQSFRHRPARHHQRHSRRRRLRPVHIIPFGRCR